MQGCLLVDSHKSTSSGPVRSPVSCPSKKPEKHNQKQKKTANKNHTTTTKPKQTKHRVLGLCCFLPPVLLPSRASALSCLASLHLSPSPRALVLLLCLPAIMVLCLGWCLWLLLLCVFGLSSWRGLFFVLFGLFGFVVLFVPGWFLCFVFCCWWLLCWTGTLVYFAFTCALRPLSQLD